MTGILILICVLLFITAIGTTTLATLAVLCYLRLQGVNLWRAQDFLEQFRRQEDDRIKTQAWRSRL